jgi:hypothetical protein
MPVLRRGGKVSDIDSCGLSFSELQELWLGVGPNGSLFRDEAELRAAWAAGRVVCMRIWASGARRPMAWWYLEAPGLGLKWPGRDQERSYLYANNVLGEEERLTVEAEWQRSFDETRRMGARERREHLAFHDVPASLVEAWTVARRRRARARGAAPGATSGVTSEAVQENALDLASRIEGKAEESGISK